MNEKKIKCIKCSNDLFFLEERRECEKCDYNGAYDCEEDKYIYNEDEILKKELVRDQASENNECFIGDSLSLGCMIFTCTHCGFINNVPYNEK